MAKAKSTSLKSMFVLALVAASFVAAIAWGAFDDLSRVAIAAGITFVVVILGFLVLNRVGKEDDFKPGQQRLK
jgi:MFS-type transporter involved in bile tolerance (Atg22 family)